MHVFYNDGKGCYMCIGVINSRAIVGLGNSHAESISQCLLNGIDITD